MELFKILGTISVNNSEANEAIDKTSGKAESFSSKLGSGVKTVAKWGTAIAGAAVAAGIAMTKFATKAAETGDNIDKMSQKIGVSREAYQELDFICSQSGTSVDTLQAGMKSLTAAMDGAASGTQSNIEQFNQLGVSVTDANGQLRSQEDVMWETLSALQGMENQTEKARLATELFGRSGTELMPLLNGATGSIDEMKQQAHDLGLVLSDEVIDSSVNLTDTLDQTKKAFSAMGTKLASSLMPIVTDVCEYIQKSLPKINSVIERLSPILKDLFEKLLPPLMDLADQLLPIIFDLIEELIPFLSQLFESVLPVIVQILQTIMPPLLQIVQMVLPLIMDLLNALLPIIQPILEILQPILDLIVLILKPLIKLLDLILPPLISLFSTIAKILGAVLGPIFEGIGKALGWLGDQFGKLADTAKESFSKMKDSIEEHGGGIKGFIGYVGDSIKENWSMAFKKMDEITGGKLSEMKKKIEEKGGGIKGFFKTLGDDIKENWSENFNKMDEATGGKLTEIKDKFAEFRDDILEKWESIKEKIANSELGQAAAKAFDEVKAAVDEKMGDIKTACQEYDDEIEADSANTIDSVKANYTAGFNFIDKLTKGKLSELQKNFSNATTKIHDDLKKKFDKMKATVVSALNSMWSKMNDIWKNIGISTKTKVESIVDSIKEKFENAYDTVKGIFQSIYDAIVGPIEEAKTSVKNTFQDLYNKIVTPMQNASNAVKKAVDTIKNAFKFEWKWPALKLPHIKVTGDWDFEKKKYPQFSVEWYAKGGILNSPTLFGFNGNNPMIGGEAGPEAVAPIDVLQGYVSEAVAKQNASLVDVLQKILLAIYSVDDSMRDKFTAALNDMRFDINNREFARLVKQV